MFVNMLLCAQEYIKMLYYLAVWVSNKVHRSNRVKLLSDIMEEGIEPESLLFETSRFSSFERTPMSSTRLPEKKFS
uniref:Uncharacterized protein n=1 Tax=Solanum lycopersicum TaxID=4081 RepID=A0A3Q7HEU3_SOLLC